MCRSGYEELGFKSIGHCQISRLVSQNAYRRPVEEEEECDFSAELRSEVGSYGAKEDFVGRENVEDETEHPHVKEVCKLIEVRHVWEPKLEKELRCTLRKLTPSQVSAVLQVQEDERVAANFLFWADRQSPYTHGIGVYYSLLKILSKTNLCQGARRVLKSMIRRGHECLPEAFNYVMISCSRADRLQDAMRVLKLMQIYGCKPDLSTYNTVIHVLVMSNRLDKVLKYFNQMQQMGIPPKIITFNILVKGLCQVHRLDKALQLMREMPFRGCPPDEITYNTILSFLCNHRKIDEVRDMLKTWGRMHWFQIRPLIPLWLTCFQSMVMGKKHWTFSWRWKTKALALT